MRRYADPPAAYSAINSTNTQYKGRAFRIPEMTRWVVVLVRPGYGTCLGVDGSARDDEVILGDGAVGRIRREEENNKLDSKEKRR